MFFGLMMHQLIRNLLAESQHQDRLPTAAAARSLARPRAGLLARLAAFVSDRRRFGRSSVVVDQSMAHSNRKIRIGSEVGEAGARPSPDAAASRPGAASDALVLRPDQVGD
jgi:hypothetical protein